MESDTSTFAGMLFWGCMAVAALALIIGELFDWKE